MPNPVNYRSDIGNIIDKTYSPSRIVRFPQDTVLFETLPAAYGFDSTSNVEVHFYSLPTNILQLSLIIEPVDVDVLKSHIVSHPDGTLQHYLRIDFTALFEKKAAILLPGEYNVVLNFFANEIGSYTNQALYIQEISDSRTEVQLAFFETTDLVRIEQNQAVLKEFVEPALDKIEAVGVAEKVFFSGLQLNDSTEGITFDSILANITAAPNQTLQNSINRINRLGVEEQFKQQIEFALVKIFENLRERIIIEGDERLQRAELDAMVLASVQQEVEALKSIVNDRIVLL